MYYEEKVIDGVLNSRGGPNDPWIPLTLKGLTDKYLQAERDRGQIAIRWDEQRRTLEAIRALVS